MKQTLLVCGLLSLFCFTECFIPADIMEKVINKVDSKFSFDFGQVGKTYVHEEIAKRGIIRSVVKFFYDQENGSTKIDLSKSDNEYQDLNNLYNAYYDKKYCKLSLDTVISDEIQPNVALVDFDKKTKDFPYAHFDAETFVQSNQRVIDYTGYINEYLSKKDYKNARRLTGQILHTIQDFYSHSNWVEIGHSEINSLIGMNNFSTLPLVEVNQNFTCLDNCSKTEIGCGTFVTLVIGFIKFIGITTSISCPLTYYKCQGNIVELNKLVSGYYTGQKLEDDSEVLKPTGLYKCSHGGILDKSVFVPAQGGINKDSGYYLFSPHANLHETAAKLAINHTEYFLSQIRARIGDSEFSNFLKILPDTSTQEICAGISLRPFSIIFYLLIFALCKLF